MLKTATIQTRVDPAVKKNVQKILKIPNELTAKTLRDAENGKNIHTVNSVNQLFQELDS